MRMAMTGNPKDPRLETARRHVREGAARVTRQQALTARLDRLGCVELAKQAADVLSTLKTSLRLAREDLLERETALARSKRYPYRSTILGNSTSGFFDVPPTPF